MLHWVMYDATKALSWRDKVRAGSLQCTVGEHNSAMAMLASALDVLSDPAAIAPPGSSRMQYPELTYPGPVEQFAGKACPVVGTYRTAPLDPDRAALFNACVEALRVNAWTHPAPGAVGGTAPSGALLSTQYPAGVLGVDGYAAPCVYPADDPAAPLTEDASAVPVAQFLGVAMAVADQLTADSANGRPQASMDAVLTTMGAGTDPALRATLIQAVQYDAMKKNDQARKRKIALGVAGVVVLGAVGARLVLKKKQGAAGVVALK